MAEILGKFTSSEFKVLKPKQQQSEQSGEDGEPNKGGDSDGESEEIPLKDKQQILDDLNKAGINSDEKNEEGEPAPYDIGDKSESKEEAEEDKEGKGTSDEEDKDKDGKEGKPTEEKSETQKKIDAKNEKLKEERNLIRTKNSIVEKINAYNTILIKHGDNLPPKVKNTLNKAIEELQELRNSIKNN